jgi:transcription initiation factor TFIID subunit 5
MDMSYIFVLQSACRKDADKLEKVKALREASKRVTLGPETLPSICFYTLLNSAGV